MTALARAGRYWHTLKHLKPVQFHGRLRFKLQRPRLDLSPAPTLRPVEGPWRSPARRAPSMTGPRRFRFLNEDGTLERADWEEPSKAKLWLYNLHYFDDLNAGQAAERDAWHASLLDDWVRHHPPGTGTGWEPYPTSLRIVNWIKRHLDGRALTAVQRDSLAVQTRWLSQRLEWHLLGNHLFANAKALVFAGLVFDQTEADSWLNQGLDIIEKELPEQVLADGGNFERSPMYHAIFLEDVLDLVNIAQTFPGRITAPVITNWRSTATRMASWMQATRHPDGEISLFNDAAIGIAPSPAALVDYATRVGVSVEVRAARPGATAVSVTSLPESGYIRIEARDAVALLDVAPVGPDYLPGHAHADTLSFELSVYGQRVVVNGGTSRYGLGAERLRERGTAAHSTLMIDGQDSSEVWGGFRVARRAYPFDLSVKAEKALATVGCSHDGYMRLAGRPVHRREWQLAARKLTVSDSVTGRFSHAEARYHFHPGVTVERIEAGRLRIRLSNGQHLHMQALGSSMRIEPSRYASAFGEVQGTHCAVVEVANTSACVEFEWT